MKLPDDSERHLIAGRTGSGKTTEGLHQFSQRSFDRIPWLLLDTKGNDLLARVPVTAPLSLADPLPIDPGVYVVRVGWEDAEPGGRLESYLMDVCDRGGIGTFVDEGQTLGHRHRGLRTLLTRGRSAGCPVIFLCQRPMEIDTFALSESEYLQFFELQHPDDYERVWRFMPKHLADIENLPPYHSVIYQPRTKQVELLGPCPPFEVIRERIATRMPRYEEPEDEPLPRRVRV